MKLKIPRKNNKQSQLRSHRGQITVEMVLLLTIMIFSSYMLLGQFKEAKVIYKFISKPWKTIAGMMESGIWKEKGDALASHPNLWKRMRTQEGVSPAIQSIDNGCKPEP